MLPPRVNHGGKGTLKVHPKDPLSKPVFSSETILLEQVPGFDPWNTSRGQTLVWSL